MDKVLGRIAFYCRDNKLPVPTAIVVGGKSGAPGGEIPLPRGEIAAERERVHREDWGDIVPPGVEDLTAADDARR